MVEDRIDQPRQSFSTPQSTARATTVMALGTLVSRILGLVKSPILLGAVVMLNSPVAGAYDIANKLPTLIYLIIAGGLVNAVLVPAIVRASKNPRDGGAAFINKLLTLTIVVLGVITLLMVILAPLLVRLYASTMTAEWLNLTVTFAYWCLPQVFFYGLYTVLGQILNARENFGPYMWAPALNNVVAIIGMLAMLAVWGGGTPGSTSDAALWAGRAWVLGGVSTLGIITQAFVLIIPMRRLGIHFRPDFTWRGVGLGRVGRASWWVLLTMGLGMIPTMFQSNSAAGATDRAHAGGMALDAVAGNAAYTAAYAIYSLPTSLIVVSLTTAMFTKISSAAADRNVAAVRAHTSNTLITASVFTFLATVLLVVLAEPVARIFSPFIPAGQVLSLARVIVAMSLGLVWIGMINVLTRVFYAFEDTKSAFWLGLPFQIFAMVAFWACGRLAPENVVVAIGCVMAIGNVGLALVQYGYLAKRLRGINGPHVLEVHIKLAAISTVLIAVGWVSMRLVGPENAATSITLSVVLVAVYGVLLTAGYIAGMKVLRLREADILVDYAAASLRKVRR